MRRAAAGCCWHRASASKQPRVAPTTCPTHHHLLPWAVAQAPRVPRGLPRLCALDSTWAGAQVGCLVQGSPGPAAVQACERPGPLCGLLRLRPGLWPWSACLSLGSYRPLAPAHPPPACFGPGLCPGPAHASLGRLFGHLSWPRGFGLGGVALGASPAGFGVGVGCPRLPPPFPAHPATIHVWALFPWAVAQGVVLRPGSQAQEFAPGPGSVHRPVGPGLLRAAPGLAASGDRGPHCRQGFCAWSSGPATALPRPACHPLAWCRRPAAWGMSAAGGAAAAPLCRSPNGAAPRGASPARASPKREAQAGADDGRWLVA